MANGNPNGRDRHRDDDERHFDQAARDRETEHYGGGQSGYGSGRLGGDRTMGPAFRNQESGNRTDEDRQGVHTDERFTGRGGEGYWLDRREREPRGNPSAFRGGGNAGAQVANEYNNARYPDMTGPRSGNVGQPPVGGHRGKGPAGYTRSDERIKESVSEALMDDDQVDATHIEVVVKNGEVLLTGVVEDRRMKRLAEDVIDRIPGVKDVQNQLRCGGNQNAGSAVGKTETETSSPDTKPRG